MKVNMYIFTTAIVAQMLYSCAVLSQTQQMAANVVFGHSSSPYAPCNNNGLCVTGGSSGVTAYWATSTNYSGTSAVEGLAFYLPSATASAHFITPQTTPGTCPNPSVTNCASGTYAIDTFVFPGNDGTGIPQGWYIPANATAQFMSYTVNTGSGPLNMAVLTVTIYAPGTNAALRKKIRHIPGEEKQVSDMRTKLLLQAAAKQQKKKK